MRTASLIIQNVIRLLAVVLIVLGFLFWTGHAVNLVPLHRVLGIVLVVLLWFLTGIAFAAHVKPPLIVAGFCWGLLTLYFGLTMQHLVPGRAHEMIRVLHFVIGVCAIGIAEVISARIKRIVTPSALRT